MTKSLRKKRKALLRKTAREFLEGTTCPIIVRQVVRDSWNRSLVSIY